MRMMPHLLPVHRCSCLHKVVCPESLTLATTVQGTEHLFNKDMISKFKKGSYLVNTARGKIAETQAVVDALESGQLRGYAGDVWYPQPAPKDHPWRTMPNHAMTPHYSGTTLDAQVGSSSSVGDMILGKRCTCI